MSSTLVKEASAQAAETKPSVAIHPVAIIDSPLAKSVALVRPILLAGLVALRFNALVADPVSTLRTALPGVAIIQFAYAVLCLPVVGSQAGKGSRKTRPGEKKKSDTSPRTTISISTAIIALLLTGILTPAVHILFVLFGAPFLDHVAHTALCAAHFALLAMFPVLYSRGSDGQALTAVAGASAPLDETFGSLVGAVVGAWLGAIPIPLDWDRDWQKWPVTILVGMYAGSLLCSSVSGTLFYGKRLGGARE
ncbi:hypothetical protein C2857_003418 [Epichloe festucae Fl1]|uniref:Glycosylphosphatidylinositol anchor biosynthesis protein 11 n=1 Tax=Epichloe festucae (strain Fl1) TaxID=877507 RepID=A0A7S9PWL5_EPIFF|nr:hypothetical protein C2857_003418 [Epichloe festucae Fl1]